MTTTAVWKKFQKKFNHQHLVTPPIMLLCCAILSLETVPPSLPTATTSTPQALLACVIAASAIAARAH